MPAITSAILAATAIAGTAVSVTGALGASDAGQSQAENSAAFSAASSGISQQNAQLEMQQNAVRKQAMTLQAKRQSIENIRNTQRASAMARNSATNQGAQFGSGIQGGIGQIQNQGNFIGAGINQNYGLGLQMFGLDDQLSANKIAMSRLQGQYGITSSQNQGDQAMWAGVSGVGSAISSSAGSLGRLFGTQTPGGGSTPSPASFSNNMFGNYGVY